MRIILPGVFLVSLLGGQAALAQSSTASDTIDPTVPAEERICETEIAEVEELRAEMAGEFTELDEQRMDALLEEARQFCEEENEVMAAIRLETVTAMIDITGPGD